MNSGVMESYKVSFDLQFFCEVRLKLFIKVAYNGLAAGGEGSGEGERERERERERGEWLSRRKEKSYRKRGGGEKEEGRKV